MAEKEVDAEEEDAVEVVSLEEADEDVKAGDDLPDLGDDEDESISATTRTTRSSPTRKRKTTTSPTSSASATTTTRSDRPRAACARGLLEL